MSEEYKPKKFDLSKGGIFTSHPPKEYGLALCKECKIIFESIDWENPDVKCEDCEEKEK